MVSSLAKCNTREDEFLVVPSIARDFRLAVPGRVRSASEMDVSGQVGIRAVRRFSERAERGDSTEPDPFDDPNRPRQPETP